MSKYRRVLDEAIKLTSINREFRTVNHMVATYEQTKKGLSYFHPKRQVQDDGFHTKPLNLYGIIGDGSSVLYFCTMQYFNGVSL